MTILTHLLAALAGAIIGVIVFAARVSRPRRRPYCTCKDGFIQD